MLLAADDLSVLSVAWLVVVTAVGVALLALFAAALVSVLRSPTLSPTGRLAWIAAVLVLPLLGPLAWFLVGRSNAAEV